jgi:hypothetical protein
VIGARGRTLRRSRTPRSNGRSRRWLSRSLVLISAGGLGFGVALTAAQASGNSPSIAYNGTLIQNAAWVPGAAVLDGSTVYALADTAGPSGTATVLAAVNAQTGGLITSFGTNGLLSVPAGAAWISRAAPGVLVIYSYQASGPNVGDLVVTVVQNGAITSTSYIAPATNERVIPQYGSNFSVGTSNYVLLLGPNVGTGGGNREAIFQISAAGVLTGQCANNFAPLPAGFFASAGTYDYSGGVTTTVIGGESGSGPSPSIVTTDIHCLNQTGPTAIPLPGGIGGSQNQVLRIEPDGTNVFITGGYRTSGGQVSFNGQFNYTTGHFTTGYPVVSSTAAPASRDEAAVFGFPGSADWSVWGQQVQSGGSALSGDLQFLQDSSGAADGAPLTIPAAAGFARADPQTGILASSSVLDGFVNEVPSSGGGGAGMVVVSSGGGGGTTSTGTSTSTSSTGTSTGTSTTTPPPTTYAYDFGNAPWDSQPTGYDPGHALTGVFPSANSAYPDFPPPVLPQDKYAPYATVHGGVYLGASEDGEANAKTLEVDNDGVTFGPSAPVCATVVHHGFHKVVRHYTRPLNVTVTLDGVAPAGGKKVYLNFWVDEAHAGNWNGSTDCHGFIPDHQLVNLPVVIPGGAHTHTFHLVYREGYDTSPTWTRTIVTLSPLPKSPKGAEGGESLPGKAAGFIGPGEIEDWLSPPVSPPPHAPAPPAPPKPPAGGRPPCSGNVSLGTIFYRHYIPPGGFTELRLPCGFNPKQGFTDPNHMPTSITFCLSVDFPDFALVKGRYVNWTMFSPRCFTLMPGQYRVINPTEIDFNGVIQLGQWFAIVSTPVGDFIPANTIIVRPGPYA